MKRYVAEVIGTFAIVFCGTGAIIINQEMDGAITHAGIAITFGLVVMTMIYALGDISGAHFNPAVSLGFVIAGKFPLKELPFYVISQVAGALLASVMLKIMFPDNLLLGSTIPSGSGMQSFVMETILTFFLMLVILSVAYGSKERGMLAGLAIGGVVLLEAMFAGPVSGASMNPARSLAPAMVSGQADHVWIYLTAPFLGAILAVGVWTFLTRQNTKNT